MAYTYTKYPSLSKETVDHLGDLHNGWHAVNTSRLTAYGPFSTLETAMEKVGRASTTKIATPAVRRSSWLYLFLEDGEITDTYSIREALRFTEPPESSVTFHVAGRRVGGDLSAYVSSGGGLYDGPDIEVMLTSEGIICNTFNDGQELATQAMEYAEFVRLFHGE